MIRARPSAVAFCLALGQSAYQPLQLLLLPLPAPYSGYGGHREVMVQAPWEEPGGERDVYADRSRMYVHQGGRPARNGPRWSLGCGPFH